MLELLLFVLALALDTALLFTMIVMFSDLECDMINPIEMCSKINPFVLPEFGVQAFIALLMLLSFNWTMFLWNLPLLLFNAYLVHGNAYWYDPTEIFPTLTRRKIESFVKLAFYLLSFFFYLYRYLRRFLLPFDDALELSSR